MQDKDKTQRLEQENQPVAKKPILDAEDALNTVTLATIIGAAVVTVGHPLKRLISSIVGGTSIWPKQVTFSTIVSALYRGGKSAFTGSLAKGTVSAGARKSQAETTLHEEITEEGMRNRKFNGLFHNGVAALVETLVTKYPDTRASINSFGIEYPTTYRNVKTTLRFGAASTLSSSFISFCAALTFHKYLIERVTFIPNESLKHLTVGAFCGASATLLTFPLTGFFDYMTTKMKVTHNGVLVAPDTWSTLKCLARNFKTNPKAMLQEVFPNAGSQLKVRVIRSSAVLATVSFTMNAVGPKPFTDMVTALKGNETLHSFKNNCNQFFQSPKKSDQPAPSNVDTPEIPKKST